MAVRISEALSRMADDSRLRGVRLPRIETDLHSAMILSAAICEDTGLRPLLNHDDPKGCVGMFDGVAIVVSPRSRLRIIDEGAWLNHFGPLAEAFS